MKETPDSRIDLRRPSPDLAHLEQRMGEFIAPRNGDGAEQAGGAWTQLMSAQEKLSTLVTKHLLTPEWLALEQAAKEARERGERFLMPTERPEKFRNDVVSHRSGVSAEDNYRLLVEGYGLKEEFRNGPEFFIETTMRNPEDAEPFELAVRNVISNFGNPSQLAIALQHQTSDNPQPLAGVVPLKETKIQAIGRMADEVEQWAIKNYDHIHQQRPEDIEAITATLKEYRAAYAQVQRFVADAQDVLNPDAPARLHKAADELYGITNEFIARPKLPIEIEEALEELDTGMEGLRAVARVSDNVEDAYFRLVDIISESVVEPQETPDEHNGAWARLYNSRTRLLHLMTEKNGEGKSTLKAGTIKHRDDLTDIQFYDLLIEKMGLRGEFGNSAGNQINHLRQTAKTDLPLPLHEKAAAMDYIGRVKKMLDVFDAPSQHDFDDLIDGVSYATSGLDGKKIKETKLQAIDRIGNEIEAWVNLNADRPESALDIKAMRKELSKYRQAAEDVKAYVTQAKQIFSDLKRDDQRSERLEDNRIKRGLS